MHMEVADRPGRAVAPSRRCSASRACRSSRCVQRGLGEHARLVMVIHPVLESRLRAAIERIAGFEFVRSVPRTIRVIEEEFV